MAATYLENVFAEPDTLRAAVDAYRTVEFEQALDEAAALLRGRAVTSTGMGASFFALTATRASLDPAFPVHYIDETSLLDEQQARPGRSLDALLAVSQSGETVEARKLLPKLPHVPKVLITRDVTSSLAQIADVVLPQQCPPDLSVSAQTYLTQIAVLELLAARVAGRDTAAVLADLLAAADAVSTILDTMFDEIEAAAKLMSQARQIYALGRGGSVASALGTGLLLKEAAKRDCEGQSTAQFRHGAVEVVSNHTAALVFASSDAKIRQLDMNVIGELLKYGSRVVVVADGDFPGIDGATQIRLPNAPVSMRHIVEIVPSQLMAYHLAVHNGVTAGEFLNTVPVIVSA